MSNKILVTGGTGYIGSHTILELYKYGGFEVLSADNYANSTPETLNRIEKIAGKRPNHYQVDLCDLEATETIFKENPDLQGIIHFAALKSVGESVADPVLYYKNNNNSLLNILSLCEKYNVRNLIFSSSCSVYGNVETLPVTEGTPMGRAESPYAHTKQMGEEIIKHFQNKDKNLHSILLRYFNPVGAHESGLNGEIQIQKPNNLVPIITMVAAGHLPGMQVYGDDYDTRDGSCIRDYIHVSDIADAHVKAINYLLDQKNVAACEVFNLGSGNGVTVFEAIDAFEKASGQKLKYQVGKRRAGDVVSIYSNSAKAKEKLGWQAEKNIDEMMRSAWKWQIQLDNE